MVIRQGLRRVDRRELIVDRKGRDLRQSRPQREEDKGI
jgi:hypothetical protein